MKRKPLISKGLSPLQVFRLGLIALVTFTLLQLPIYEGKAFFTLLHPNPEDTFMDFFNSVHEAANSADPYTQRGVIYPPLTYLFYRMCAMVLPGGQTALQWRNSQQGLLLILAITVLTMVALYRTLRSEDKRFNRTVLWVLLGTVPFWYALERGNLILQSLVFVAYFIRHYRSESKVKRELALISLAISAAIKIYPALFGVLLLLNKQFKEAVRCILYGLIAVFAPFAIFGGMDAIAALVGNIANANDAMAIRGWGYKVNLQNTMEFLAESFHVGIRGTRWAKALMGVMLIFTLLFTRKDWQRYMALTGAVVLYPAFSYTYTLIFAVIPLLTFLREAPRASLRNLLFSLLFLGLFAPFPLDGGSLFDKAPVYPYMLNLTTAISGFALLAMVAMMVWDVIACRWGSAAGEDKQLSVLGLTVPLTTVLFCVIALILLILVAGWYFYCDGLYKMDIVS